MGKPQARSHRKMWTPEELEFVKTYYGIVPTAKIAEILGRTFDAVRWARQQSPNGVMMVLVLPHQLNTGLKSRGWYEHPLDLSLSAFLLHERIYLQILLHQSFVPPPIFLFLISLT
ncbi:MULTISPECIES: hypothetical protein [Citrobacter]|uniref:hypothetical protein n=1 Tax=Citrobacter TaxID=544 RepID=UPI00257648CE|nr:MULTISPECIES: hypothetical protein [Citrobacter]MDM2948199.1 hypothetical protein [Citrobacter sp. CK207]MEB2704940.1 hypothetical protein [Citrobacter koseri]MEB2708956.1 hypothetical protein [Citrobacter koseri]MEB2771987.1 hypothetical protein [Citrobacter koseri]WOJ27037.1 hypothetical protein R1221_04035 [Citrobacter koseri]